MALQYAKKSPYKWEVYRDDKLFCTFVRNRETGLWTAWGEIGRSRPGVLGDVKKWTEEQAFTGRLDLDLLLGEWHPHKLTEREVGALVKVVRGQAYTPERLRSQLKKWIKDGHIEMSGGKFKVRLYP